MYKHFLFALLCLFLSASAFSQRKLSSSEQRLILDDLQSEIKILNRFEFSNPEVLPVYGIQLRDAQKTLDRYKSYSSDIKVFEKWNELEILITQNKEMIDFLLPKTSAWLYRKAYALLSNGEKDKAYTLFMKILQTNSEHVLTNYQLGKMSLNDGKITEGTLRLVKIVKEMSPTEKEKEMVYNLLSDTYNKNYLYAISLSNQGKYSYALDILTQLDTFCRVDPLYICNKDLIAKTLIQCRQGVYDDHLKIVDKAMKQKEYDIAADFVVWAYDYFDENRDEIKDTLKFAELAKRIAQRYINEAKSGELAKKAAVREELLERAMLLASLTDDDFRKSINSQASALLPTKSDYVKKIEKIEAEAEEESLSEKFVEYVVEEGNDSISQKDIDKIEKAYVDEKTKVNRVGGQKKTSISKELEEKFFETRSLLAVNNYEKALEILHSTNKLAKINSEKKEVEEMYRQAIREITAKRMSSAEYLIWQGQQASADSLIDLTNDLITTYKMSNDPEIIRIMNSYLSALDKKACQKKQDEINGFIYNIMDCIKRYDYHKADAHIRNALAIPATKNCRLDKSKVRALMKQIEKPLEYTNLLKQAYQTLQNFDTNGYILQYAELEDIYVRNDLALAGINHVPMREIIATAESTNFALKVVEVMVRHKYYMIALESLGALKDMEYNSSETKKIQERIAKLMSLEMYKLNYTYNESLQVIEKYTEDKWYKYFVKDYKKNARKWEKGAKLK